MIKINEIDLDYDPRRKILSKLPAYVSPQGYREPEMSEFESAFLCGVLRKFRPKKILEVGVAGGATTAIILQALEDIGEPYEMHSIDVSANFYRDKTKQTGFMAEMAKENNLFAPPQSTLSGEHKFHLGKFLPQVIDEIGNEIDFVILDTKHSMPGEVLDFLAVLPYLKINAVFVLHDVALCQYRRSEYHATTVLLSAVTAIKYLNFVQTDVNSKFSYPNIAAFQINQQTLENIENIFLTLILRWHYMPSQGEINLYRFHYKRYYSKEMLDIYNEAVKMNVCNKVMDTPLRDIYSEDIKKNICNMVLASYG